MINRARLRGMIAYSDLVREIRSNSKLTISAYFTSWAESRQRKTAGRGMLTVVVVHKTNQTYLKFAD